MEDTLKILQLIAETNCKLAEINNRITHFINIKNNVRYIPHQRNNNPVIFVNNRTNPKWNNSKRR